MLMLFPASFPRCCSVERLSMNPPPPSHASKLECDIEEDGTSRYVCFFLLADVLACLSKVFHNFFSTHFYFLIVGRMMMKISPVLFFGECRLFPSVPCSFLRLAAEIYSLVSFGIFPQHSQ